MDQYCPIAKALELLAERWTLLLVRELLMGSRRFNELRRGVPLMAPSVMSQRLRSLAEAGIIVRAKQPRGRSADYRLTPAGEELRPLINQLGTWGQRWSRSRMTVDDLDASFLMWDIRRNLRTRSLPSQRTTIAFEFPDAKKGMQHWWLVADHGEVDLCLEDPGHEVDVHLTLSLQVMTQIWMGDLSLSQARGKGLLKVVGTRGLTRTVGDWLGGSPFAHIGPAAPALASTALETAQH